MSPAVEPPTAPPQDAGRTGAAFSGPEPRPWYLERWATWLAVAAAALLWGADVESLRELTFLLALVYAVVVATGRPRTTWPVFGCLFLVFLAVTAQDRFDPGAVLLAVSAGAIFVGALRSHGPGRVPVAVQAAGVVLFGAAALLAAEVAPGAAVYLVAGGYFAHAAWDLVHWWRQEVIARSYAEWCGVLDLLVGVTLLLTAT